VQALGHVTSAQQWQNKPVAARAAIASFAPASLEHGPSPPSPGRMRETNDMADTTQPNPSPTERRIRRLIAHGPSDFRPEGASTGSTTPTSTSYSSPKTAGSERGTTDGSGAMTDFAAATGAPNADFRATGSPQGVS
jgi:hypothetical protein